MNPECQPTPDSPAKQKGRSLHKLVLEGEDAFASAFAVALTGRLFRRTRLARRPEVKCRELGAAVSGTKAELAKRIKAKDPKAVVFDDIFATFRVMVERDGLEVLKPDAMREVRQATTSITLRDPDGQHEHHRQAAHRSRQEAPAARLYVRRRGGDGALIRRARSGTSETGLHISLYQQRVRSRQPRNREQYQRATVVELFRQPTVAQLKGELNDPPQEAIDITRRAHRRGRAQVSCHRPNAEAPSEAPVVA
jgi:hypothetical protein